MVRERARGVVDAVDTLNEPTGVRRKRSIADAPQRALVSGEDAVKERAQLRESRMGDKWSAVEAPKHGRCLRGYFCLSGGSM